MKKKTTKKQEPRMTVKTRSASCQFFKDELYINITGDISNLVILRGGQNFRIVLPEK